jgi:hypothetical protein
MATKFVDYMANHVNPRGVLCKLGVFLSSVDDELYIEAKDPTGGTVVTVSNSLIPVAYDTIEVDLSGVTTDVYTYKLVGATVAVLTITYVDATKAVITTVVRT